jgi:hypothetical protein
MGLGPICQHVRSWEAYLLGDIEARIYDFMVRQDVADDLGSVFIKISGEVENHHGDDGIEIFILDASGATIVTDSVMVT